MCLWYCLARTRLPSWALEPSTSAALRSCRRFRRALRSSVKLYGLVLDGVAAVELVAAMTRAPLEGGQWRAILGG